MDCWLLEYAATFRKGNLLATLANGRKISCLECPKLPVLCATLASIVENEEYEYFYNAVDLLWELYKVMPHLIPFKEFAYLILDIKMLTILSTMCGILDNNYSKLAEEITKLFDIPGAIDLMYPNVENFVWFDWKCKQLSREMISFVSDVKGRHEKLSCLRLTNVYYLQDIKRQVYDYVDQVNKKCGLTFIEMFCHFSDSGDQKTIHKQPRNAIDQTRKVNTQNDNRNSTPKQAYIPKLHTSTHSNLSDSYNVSCGNSSASKSIQISKKTTDGRNGLYDDSGKDDVSFAGHPDLNRHHIGDHCNTRTDEINQSSTSSSEITQVDKRLLPCDIKLSEFKSTSGIASCDEDISKEDLTSGVVARCVLPTSETEDKDHLTNNLILQASYELHVPNNEKMITYSEGGNLSSTVESGTKVADNGNKDMEDLDMENYQDKECSKKHKLSNDHAAISVFPSQSPVACRPNQIGKSVSNFPTVQTAAFRNCSGVELNDDGDVSSSPKYCQYLDTSPVAKTNHVSLVKQDSISEKYPPAIPVKVKAEPRESQELSSDHPTNTILKNAHASNSRNAVPIKVKIEPQEIPSAISQPLSTNSTSNLLVIKNVRSLQTTKGIDKMIRAMGNNRHLLRKRINKENEVAQAVSPGNVARFHDWSTQTDFSSHDESWSSSYSTDTSEWEYSGGITSENTSIEVESSLLRMAKSKSKDAAENTGSPREVESSRLRADKSKNCRETNTPSGELESSHLRTDMSKDSAENHLSSSKGVESSLHTTNMSEDLDIGTSATLRSNIQANSPRLSVVTRSKKDAGRNGSSNLSKCNRGAAVFEHENQRKSVSAVVTGLRGNSEKTSRRRTRDMVSSLSDEGSQTLNPKFDHKRTRISRDEGSTLNDVVGHCLATSNDVDFDGMSSDDDRIKYVKLRKRNAFLESQDSSSGASAISSDSTKNYIDNNVNRLLDFSDHTTVCMFSDNSGIGQRFSESSESRTKSNRIIASKVLKSDRKRNNIPKGQTREKNGLHSTIEYLEDHVCNSQDSETSSDELLPGLKRISRNKHLGRIRLLECVVKLRKIKMSHDSLKV